MGVEIVLNEMVFNIPIDLDKDKEVILKSIHDFAHILRRIHEHPFCYEKNGCDNGKIPSYNNCGGCGNSSNHILHKLNIFCSNYPTSFTFINGVKLNEVFKWAFNNGQSGNVRLIMRYLTSMTKNINEVELYSYDPFICKSFQPSYICSWSYFNNLTLLTLGIDSEITQNEIKGVINNNVTRINNLSVYEDNLNWYKQCCEFLGIKNYLHNPKHDPKNKQGKRSNMYLQPKIAQELLDDAIQDNQGNRFYNKFENQLFVFPSNNDTYKNTYHGYPEDDESKFNCHIK